MKKSILSALLILGIFTLTKAQVTGINYLIEYNDSTSYYDCKIVIASGEATTIPQRIQFNAQYSIVVPTGVDCSIVENHNPLESNYNYMGTIPCNWEIGMTAISPYEIPYDYYSITPDLGITSSYNNLFAGDTVSLFSLSVDLDPCDNEVRPYDNETDYEGWGFQDFSNGFTMGNITQIYNDNLKSTYGIINVEEPINLCPGTTTSIYTELNGIWESSNPEIASVDEVTGTITSSSSGSTNISFIDNISGCLSFIEVEVLDIPDVYFIGDDEICIGEVTSVSSVYTGTWYLSDISVAAFDNSGNIIGLSEGAVILIYSDNETGCISNPLTLTVLPPSDPSCLVNVNNEISTNVTVFPNPAKEMVYIETDSPIQSISIYTSDYKKVEEVVFTSPKNESQMSLTKLNPGFYFLRIKSNDKYVFTKLILD